VDVGTVFTGINVGGYVSVNVGTVFTVVNMDG
jgi:hypothetical protein